MNRAATWLGLVVIMIWCSGCVTQMALEDAKTRSHLEFAQPAFSTNDILDAASLTRKIQTMSDSVSEFLGASMQPAAHRQLEAAAGNQDSNQLRTVLVIVLNKAIARPSLYDATRFQKISLRRETKKLLKQKADPARVNRLLLEDAYPTELARMPDPKVVVDKKGKPGGYTLVPFAVMGDVALLPVYVIVSPFVIVFAISFAINGPGC